MNRRTIFHSARNGAALALGVAGVFGATFAVTTLVASAAEEQTPAPAAQPAPGVDVQAPAPAAGPAPAPRSDLPPPRPPRPAFRDMDANGDGQISQQEFEAFRPAPPPRFGEGQGPRGDRPERGPGDEGRGRGPREDRFNGGDDRYGPPPPSDDRFGSDRGPRGGRGGDQYGRYDEQGGGDCDHQRGPRGGEERGPRPHGAPGGRDFGPPPGGPDDGYGPPDDRPRPPRRPGE